MQALVFFFRLYVWFGIRNLRRSPGRTAAVLLGVALGAAVFTSVRLSVNASTDSFAQSMDRLTGRSDLTAIQPGGEVSEHLISRILNHPAVEGASPLMTTYVRSSRKDSEPFLLIGLDPLLDGSFRKWTISQTEAAESLPWVDLMKDPYTLFLGHPVARQNNSWPGDRITLEHTRQTRSFRVLGILAEEELGLVEGGQVAVVDIATFQEFTGSLGGVDRIDLDLKKDAAASELRDLRDSLPPGTLLQPASAARVSGERLIRSYELNLSILSFASLFVGMFLVYSLVALNAASRRHELAVLRSLGASGRFLFAMFLAEGAFLGIFGWVLAVPISALLVRYLIHGVTRTIATLFVRVQVETLTLSGWEILLSFAVTVTVSVLAAFQPAQEAMEVPPKEAMEVSRHGVRFQRPPLRLAVIGLGCILLVFPLARLPGFSGMPLPGYLAMFLLFAGFSMAAPWILQWLGKKSSPVLRRVGGIPAFLGTRYVTESGTRTAVSVGALLTAVALFTAIVIMIYSFRQTVELWTRQTVSGDLFLTAKMGELNRFQYPLPQATVDALRALRSDVDLVPSRRIRLDKEGFPYEFEAFDIETFLRYGAFVWLEEDPEKNSSRTIDRILEGVIRGEGVLVSEVFSNRTGLFTGDTFEARIGKSMVELPILGIVRDYRTDGGVVFYSLPRFVSRYHDPGWSGVRFFFRNRPADIDRAVSGLRREIIESCGENLDMIAGERLRRGILKIFDETFAVTTVLLLIALIIAALGIATTLTVRVLERMGQINTLFAVGAGYGQIRSMIFWEAAFMAVVGEAAGLLCGFALSFLLIYVINRQSFGWTFLFGVDWTTLAMSLPLIVLTALASALPALRMVFRRPPATILRSALSIALFLLLQHPVLSGGLEGADGEKERYPAVTGPCNLAFPGDHGPHPAYRTEWWYYTGNLTDASGRPFGFQLTFFRSRIGPPGFEASWPNPASSWRTEQIYLGHAAVADISGKRHLQAERISRGVLKMAGAVQRNSTTSVFIGNWAAEIGHGRHRMRASTDTFSFDLTGSPSKPPVLHGISGYSRKGSSPERASCYYSLTRVKTEGMLTVSGESNAVTGSAWMDHEFSTAPLEPGIVGWDWFGLQLSDNTEIMIYLLRNRDAAFSEASAGTIVDERGNTRRLELKDIQIKVMDSWKSPHSRAAYPARWQVRIPSLSLEIEVQPRIADQEMKTPASTRVTYWEGAVSLEGRKGGQPIRGHGYVELTGYDKPMDF
jgi:putative ABC transport system permease protein